MGRVKRQHYVPRSYLRRFTADGTQIFTFDKVRGTSFRTNIENVAVEGAFHDLPPEMLKSGADTQLAEKALAELESEFVLTMDVMLETVRRTGSIRPEQKEAMSFFLSLQFLRTSHFRNTFKDTRHAVVSALEEKLTRLNVPKEVIDAGMERNGLLLREEEVQPTHVSLMLDPKLVTTIAEALKSHVWLVGVIENGPPLYTSDNPVVHRSHSNYTGPPIGDGLGSPGIEVAFPLDPKCVLVLYEKSFFGDYGDLDSRAVVLVKRNVDYYNSMQVVKSRRWVYSSTENFDIAAEMCRDYPELADPKKRKPRVVE